MTRAVGSLDGMRRFSRRAWWLHFLLIIQLSLAPLPHAWPSWVDTDSDGTPDTFTDPLTGQDFTLSQLNDLGEDIDGDGAMNDEELEYGSNPFVYDTDGDGLNDGDEIHLAIQQQGKNYSLTSWDSNGDGISDHDDFHDFFGVIYPIGELPAFPGASYSDYDGDGIKNPHDPHPLDPSNNDADGDGIDDDYDPEPSDMENYSPWNGETWGITAIADADHDGVINFYDPFPYDRFNYSPNNELYWYSNLFGDDDNDGYPNFEDYYPFDPDNQSGDGDMDGDGIHDDYDPNPEDAENYSEYNEINWQGAALGDDDGDGFLNFWDPFPYDNANYSWLNSYYWYGDIWGDADGDGFVNYLDETPYGEDPGGGDPGEGDPGDGDPGDGDPGEYDTDGDGIPDNADPYPDDNSNYSDVNGYNWYSEVLDDADADGTPNYMDDTPFGDDPGEGDNDGDGIPDEYDPEPYDSSNYSYFNDTTWYSYALDDDDGDSILNFYDPYPSDFANLSSINYIEWYDNVFGDEDGDGILNYEDADPYPPEPEDADDDGLNADEEAGWGTSDNNPDSDGDGLTDYEEVHVFGTDPTDAYSISRGHGWGELYTDWQLVDTEDTDGDLIPDRIEIHYNLNPAWPVDALLDLDNDGVNNITQYNAGVALNANLSYYDADGDGMTDVFEDFYLFNKNWAGDAVLDADGDGVTNHEESVLLLNPLNPDSTATGGLGDLHWLMLAVRYPNRDDAPEDDLDVNGIPDWQDELLNDGPTAPDYWHFSRVLLGDLDGDGMPDVWEHSFGLWKHPANGLLLRKDDAHLDNDGDGLTNFQEYLLGTSPLAGDSNENGIGDGDEDLDNDGLSNAEEFVLGTNPQLADTDGDGVNDGQEIEDGTDPTDSADFMEESILQFRIQTKLH